MKYQPASITPNVDDVGIDEFENDDFITELKHRMKREDFCKELATHGLAATVHRNTAGAFRYQSIGVIE